ncbi:MAG: LysM peptidoglycan-binding domain-containing protein [Anaerolineae bacterium]
MVGKKLKLGMALALLAFTLLSLHPAAVVRADEISSPVRQDPGPNLLDNPGFEGLGVAPDNALPNPENWTRTTYNGAAYGEIFTPEGWVTWWQETDDFKRPECHVIANEPPYNGDPDRIYNGYYSGKCFTMWGKQNAGYYQVVRDVPPGSVVQGSFYAHAWSCGDDPPPAVSCGDPYSFFFRVGIDPNGGTDPFSPNIVWSSPYYHHDEYGLVGPVQATAGEAGAVTMFINSQAKWSIKHNDGYYDNASLQVMTPAETATPTPPPPPPTSETPPTLAATPTARPDGAIVHVIESGDTLFGLAITYGVDVQQIYDLNNLGPDDLLQIGQEIVISTSGEIAPTPTPTVAAAEETPEPATTPSEPSGDSGTGADSGSAGSGSGGAAPPPAGKGSVCVLAFYDSNSDMFRQPEDGEMLLPNAEVTLLARSGPVDSRTTDGISEPWCFENLDPGNYIVQHTPPPGYLSTDGGGQVSFILSEGQVMNLELGYVRDGEEGSTDQGGGQGQPSDSDTPAPTEESVTEDDGSGVTNVLNVVLRVSGFIVLALAIAVLVLFVLSRRSA